MGIRDALLQELLLALAKLPGTVESPANPYRVALSEAVVQHLAAHHMGISPPDVRGLSRALRERALAYLEASIGGSFQLANLARELGLSPSYASAQFKATFGRAPHAHFDALRMEAARRLLLTTKKPAREIAEEVGFSSPSYFGLAFKASVGMTPNAFRKTSEG